MKRYKLILLFLSMGTLVHAKVTLPSFFTNNMVVQQNTQLTLPGKAKPGKQVTVRVGWNADKYTTKASSDGSFEIKVPTPSAGGPYQITISDGEKLTLTNVMAGEVWFCSGQSNMEMPVEGWGKVMNYKQEVAQANYPSIRLLQVKKVVAFKPQENVEINMGWEECSPTTVSKFSAIAYFYARNLWNALKVPVGVIDCTWGGTPAEAWTSYETLKHVMGFEEKTARMAEAGFDKERIDQLYRQKIEEWAQHFDERDAGFIDGMPRWTSILQTGRDWKTMMLPGIWERQGLIYDGTVWFQKEIEIPAEWSGKEAVLSLGMVDDADVTYFNGKEIGRTSGYNVPRSYKIPAELVKAGKSLITVRVIDYGSDGGIYGKPESLFIEANGKKIALAGNWNYHLGASTDGMPPRPVEMGDASRPCTYPTVLYNAMVYPFIGFPIKGVIWYQGENNVNRAEEYRGLFQSMITDWRKAWKQELPFYFVQLANFHKAEVLQPDSKWAVLRDSQAHSLHLPHTGMVCTIDIGEAGDIHPKNKQEVGRRMAQLSLFKTYRQGSYEVPSFTGYRIEGRTLILTFDREVVAKGDAPKGFILAGSDGKFYPAQATIQGKEVVLQAEQVEIPTAARYAWADNPICNLYSKSGLPVPPFCTRE